jgi:multimeric flavodoxin WrbA
VLRDEGANPDEEESQVKAIALCGSPRKNGNTQFLLTRCLDVLAAHGVSGELVRLTELDLKPCTGCATCKRKQDRTCAIKDDDFHGLFEQMAAADIIVVGSPVYFGSATAQTKILLDRAGYVARSNGNLFSRKVGGPVVVARRAGQNFTYAQLMFWFIISDMVVPGSSYWNVAIGQEAGDVQNDTEGLSIVEHFAENLAWVAGKLHGPA